MLLNQKYRRSIQLGSVPCAQAFFILMGIFENLKKGVNDFLSREVRLFNGTELETTPKDKLPFLPNWFYASELGIPRGVNILELRQFAKSAWIQMVHNAIKKQLMITEWKIVPVEEDEKLEKYQADIDRATYFLNHPNSNGDTFWDLWGPFTNDVLEIDAGVIFKGRNMAGEMVELFSYDGAAFLIDMDEHGLLKRYLQYSFKHFGAKPLPFETRDIVYGAMNRRNEHYPYGWSPLQSVMQEVELMIQSTRYNKEFFQNNAVPDGIMGLDTDDMGLERWKNYWQNEIRGRPHKLAFHNIKGMDWVPLKISNSDMEWLEGQKWYFHIVFGVYGLSPQEVGFYEDSNRATSESQERITIKQAIKPQLTLIASKINRDILPELFNHGKLKFEWQLIDDAAEKTKHQQLMERLDRNVVTINEVRTQEGLPPVPWGNEPVRVPNPFSSPFVSGEREQGQRQDQKPDQDQASQERREEREEEQAEKMMEKEAPEFIEQEESKDYADFLEKKFYRWEKEIMSFLDKTLEEEFTQKDINQINHINKTFGDFLHRLMNVVNTSGFYQQLKRVIKISLQEGVDEAEKELQINVTAGEDFNRQLDFLTRRQLEGFHIEGGKWNGLKGVAKDIQIQIAEIVREGLAEKKGLKKVKAEVKELMIQQRGGKVKGEVTEGRAMKIARTETNRFRNSGKVQAYKDSGLKGKKRWVAVGDSKTTEICRRLHGQEVGLKENFFDTETGQQYAHPPALPNCRSVVQFILD